MQFELFFIFFISTQSPAQYSLIEQDALRLAKEIHAEYWAVSSLTGELLHFKNCMTGKKKLSYVQESICMHHPSLLFLTFAQIINEILTVGVLTRMWHPLLARNGSGYFYLIFFMKQM